MTRLIQKIANLACLVLLSDQGVDIAIEVELMTRSYSRPHSSLQCGDVLPLGLKDCSRALSVGGTMTRWKHASISTARPATQHAPRRP